MSQNEAMLARIITTADDIPSASLGLKIMINRLRIQARSNPAAIAAGIAELRDHLQRNPDSRSALAAL